MPSKTRRQLLAGLGAASVGFLAGCTDGSESPVAPGNDGETTTTEPGPSPAREWAMQATPSGPVRGEAEPVSAERSVTDKPGYTDGIEYFPSNSTVRYAADTGGEFFDTMSFESWGTAETATLAAERAHRIATGRLGVAERAVSEGIGGLHPGSSGDRTVAKLRIATLKDREGEVLHVPSVTLPELVEATPRAVDATVSLDGDTYSRTVPVYARYTVLQQS